MVVLLLVLLLLLVSSVSAALFEQRKEVGGGFGEGRNASRSGEEIQHRMTLLINILNELN